MGQRDELNVAEHLVTRYPVQQHTSTCHTMNDALRGKDEHKTTARVNPVGCGMVRGRLGDRKFKFWSISFQDTSIFNRTNREKNVKMLTIEFYVEQSQSPTSVNRLQKKQHETSELNKGVAQQKNGCSEDFA